MYVCGITPYDATHLGHAATYITFDLVHRYLLAAGKEVLFVENVTDIDDPLLERAKRDHLDWEDLAYSQIELFRGDMTDLHVLPPKDLIGAVESIPLVVQAIETMKSTGAVYPIDNDLYFSVRSDPDFGSRAHLSDEEMARISGQRGGDPDRAGKRDPLDALVWLAKRPDEPGWSSSLGEGRPGWHIECCAIAMNYLQPDPDEDFLVDIQGGGSDLLFPHHEMGAAQARILASKPYARAYMHSGMIGWRGEKMSKSLGNLVFLSKLVDQGHDPMAIRTALMYRNYADDHMWRVEDLEDATTLINNLRLLLSRPEVAPTHEIIQLMINAMANNLDTPSIFRALKDWCNVTESGAEGGSAGELSRALDLLLGIAL